MAVFFRDLGDAERVALTGAMTRSGTVLEWDGGPVVDKHSTGGVGDKVSLILAPVVAACGGLVPMISGRGLGHTGGTLDKLDAIPGYQTAPGLDLLRQVVGEAGCAIIGQTPELAPADRRFYALRDATATVESIPLIVGSILSKKLAAGLDALVMDVKAGSGAFMPSREKSDELARAIVAVARGNGLACEALLTDMDQVLGRTAGNAVEVRESLGVLTHPRAAEPRLVEVTLALSATLLRLGGLLPRRRGGARRGRRGARLRRRRRALRPHVRRPGRAGGPARRPRPPPAARAARARGLPAGRGARRARSPCATSASPCWSWAAGACARTARSTMPSGSSTWPGWGRRSVPAAGRSPSCTRATPRARSAPRRACAPPSRSATRPRRCRRWWRPWRERPAGRAARAPRGDGVTRT